MSIYIPGGEYEIGSEHIRMDTAPKHKITIPPFRMDDYFVTIEMVLPLIKKQMINPIYWKKNRLYPKDNPCMGLTYFEAIIIAQYYNKRLPSEEEWEIAASLGKIQNTYKKNKGPFPLLNRFSAKNKGLISENGLIGMTQIAWQWTSSKYQWYPQTSNFRFPLEGTYRVVRGGIWSFYDTHPSFRSFRPPRQGYSRVGVRLVTSQ